jgi:DNA (cytosine-5)-methyltransferase 1
LNGRAYYNEFDPYAAQWLRNLIAGGHIAPGDVDERSIVDVRPDDLRGYVQCHFFAGIGGWSLALRLAGWSDDRHVWTGSCPCQPLSRTGHRKGHADERHLWPAFYRLIAECRPSVVFGEQVTGPDGREWAAGVRADLEATDYACGIADLPAAGVRAPHNRPRLYWMAYANGAGRPAGDTVAARVGYGRPAEPGGDRSFWDDFIAHEGDVGSLRRVGAGILAVAHGIPARVGKLRAAGNAIVPQVAAEFIAAAMRSI